MKNKKKPLEREDKLTLGVFNTEFNITTVEGTEYTVKPLSVGKLGLLSRIIKKLTDVGEVETFMVMFWIAVTNINTLLQILRDENVEDQFYDFLDKFAPKDIESIVEVTKRISDISNAGAIEVDTDEKK